MSVIVGQARVSGHYIRKRLRTAVPARRLALFSGLLLGVSLLVYRLHGVDFTALQALLALVAGMAALSFLLALGGLTRAWISGHAHGMTAMQALFAALFVLAPFVGAASLAFYYPPVDTALTDGMLAADIVDAMNAGEIGPDAALNGRSLSNGRRFPATAAQAYAVSRTVLSDLGWELTDVVAGDGTAEPEDDADLSAGDLGISGTIEVPVPTARSQAEAKAAADPFTRPESDRYALSVVARDFLFALPSDIEIRLVEEEGQAYVDLRATSRLVAWDLGQNHRFIEAFMTRMDEAMAGLAAIVPPSQ